MKNDEEKKRKLQEMLSAARGALEDAISYADEHDLWFEFTGVRRAPIEDKLLDVNDPDEVRRAIEENERWGDRFSRSAVTRLDLSEEWVGSWC